MASKQGYNCKWIANPPDDLKCQICRLVARDAQLEVECGKIFCNSCITEHRRDSQTCPNKECRKQLNIVKDMRGTNNINDLGVKCDNLEKGCIWEGKLGSLNAHLHMCNYALLTCDYKCTNNGQAVKVLRKDQKDHLTNNCPRRPYPCPHCKEMGEYHERTGTHLEICPQLSVLCPNAGSYTVGLIKYGCKTMFPRWELSVHRSTCQYESVPCKYAEVGCKEKLFRKDLTKHEENNQLHLKVTTAQILELTQQLRTVEQLTFRLDDFDKRKNDKTVFYSSSLYTLHKGYKFQIQVDAGGNGSGEGTHVSIYACLMKGDHDEYLKWPFLGEATFELLNQIEDRNHHKTTVQFRDSETSHMVEGEGSEKGRGKPNFIAHKDLENNPGKYLKDDALIFRVSVKPPSYKPWLQCTHD